MASEITVPAQEAAAATSNGGKSRLRQPRAFLSHNRLWRRFRNIQAEGFYRTFKRRRLWSRILDTAPVITESLLDSAAIEIHILTYDRDYLSAIWALKSFYHYSGVRYPLQIHVQGRASARMIARLRTHFPCATIIEQAQADLTTEQWLIERGYQRLLVARRAGIMMMKLIDFILSCRGSHLLAIDSDVIFFRRPDELLAAIEQPSQKDLFMHDAASSYNISESQALRDLGIDLAPRVNCGLMLLARDDRRLARCEDYLTHSDVARTTGLIEQTLHALYDSEHGRVAYLPDNYFVSPDGPTAESQKLVCRHYAGGSRPLLTDEGMTRLIEQGFLSDTL
jgi:hypothetical protein